MLKKPTDELLGRLKESADINEYLKENEAYMIDGDIAQYLRELIKEKKLFALEVGKKLLVPKCKIFDSLGTK